MPAREPKHHDISPEVAKKRARVGALTIAGASPEELAKARAELAEALREDRIRRLVEAWPPLTPEQRERLAALLDTDSGAA